MAFLAQRPARLHACVVKFGGLTNDDRSRSDDHYVAGHAGAIPLACGTPQSWTRLLHETKRRPIGCSTGAPVSFIFS